jgi:hypothetical protein
VPTKTSKVSAELAGRNAEQLVRLWKWGRDSLKHCPSDTLVYGETANRQRSELVRLKRLQDAAKPNQRLDMALNLDCVGKVRRIAADYKEEQLTELAGLVRRHRSRFSTSHLMRSIALADRDARDAIIKKAVSESWTLSVLERHVQVARGARRSGAGRKPFIPADRDQRLVLLEGLCVRWLRWTHAAAGELQGDVRKLVRNADVAIAAVQAGLARHLPRAGKSAVEKVAKPKRPR